MLLPSPSRSLLPLVACLFLSCGDDATSPESNTAPTASFTVAPTSGTTDTTFQFDASTSSDEQDSVATLQVRWDWEDDGTWDTQWSTTLTASHIFSTPGTKSIKLEVRDTGGLTHATTRTLTVTGPGPTPAGTVLVAAGTFTMGDGSAYCGTEEHEVVLTHNFYLGQYEITNQEYRDAVQWAYDCGYVTATSSTVDDALDGSDVPLLNLASEYCQISFDGEAFAVDAGKENYPVVEVSWYGAAAYCDWLSLSSGLERAYNHSTWQINGGSPYTAGGYRLPTDAEWEYAAQYDDERIYPWGNEEPDCSRANCSGCLEGDYPGTSPVGSYPSAPAQLGLYDMAGNVWEWCNDWWTCELGTSPQTDPTGPGPTGPGSGSCRVLHGGSWGGHAAPILRCSARSYYDPVEGYFGGGFRIARTAD